MTSIPLGRSAHSTALTKIGPRHLDRVAIVYVRQSTLQQVSRNQESTRLQYGLVHRAADLGWDQDRIEVIDEDLGRSGSNAEGRPGFQRLVAEVGLDHVGLVLGIEMSRLARSCRDWHQLLEACSLFGTLIGDLDGIYDPAAYNDRLLLGLKGTMSEAELHIIKQRMHQGRLAKAHRGELAIALPMGYVRRPSGEVVKDPDERAQTVIELVFDLFARHGTIHRVLRELVGQGVRMPVRLRSGASKGELDWRRPNRLTLSNLLHSPTYAGAYVYGRRPTDPRRKVPGRPSTGRTVAERDDWQVCLKDRLPAYIDWTRYEHNLRQLQRNTASAGGSVRKGASLLASLVVCGRCGLKMPVTYGAGGYYRYACNRMAIEYADDSCQSLQGRSLDEFVSELVLRALEPAALEVSMQVAGEVEAERARMRRHWDERVERARYEAERAFRQYDAVEPENRLVVRQLERAWEEALQREQSLREERTRYLAAEPATLTDGEREAIRRLASDIPGLWNAPTTTAMDRQEIVRILVERVLVRVQGTTEKVELEIHWAGGHRSGADMVRPVARWEQLSYYPELLARIAELHGRGRKAKAIADTLNAEGWRPPKRRPTFHAAMVSTLLARQGLTRPSRGGGHPAPDLARGEWTLPTLARELEMPAITLYSWLRRGELQARKVGEGARGRWVVRADAAELERLRLLRATPRTWSQHVRVPAAP